MSQSLEIVRGYYYTAKPGMGNIILNFNLATSAFFKPILVSEFLADQETFEGCRREVLVGLRVYVESERKPLAGEDWDRLNRLGTRHKKIRAVTSENIEEIRFRKRLRGPDGMFERAADGTYIEEGSEISLVDHLNNSEYFDCVVGKSNHE